jgi:hypothetical protein
MSEREHVPSFGKRLGVASTLALSMLIIQGVPPVLLFLGLWWWGGDKNADLALVISSLAGLAWVGFSGLKICMPLMQRAHKFLWGYDTEKGR